MLVVVLDDVEIDVVVVVVVGVGSVVGGGDGPHVHAAVHGSPSPHAPPGSHSSPPPGSTTRSPHVDRMAVNFFVLSFRALTVPVMIRQVASIFALRRTVPATPSHVCQTALTRVPRFPPLSLTTIGGHPLPRDIPDPRITTASLCVLEPTMIGASRCGRGSGPRSRPAPWLAAQALC